MSVRLTLSNQNMTQEKPKFQLLESLLWEPQKGYFLLEQHLQRLERSSHYFNFTLSLIEVITALEKLTLTFGTTKQKVRLTIAFDGNIALQTETLNDGILKIGALVGIARKPIDSQIPFLYHKTTYRLPYTMALESQPQCQDVFLWNENGLITESTITNIVIDTPTGMITPPINCGLLPGTFRAQLLTEGKIREEIITLEHLRDTQTLFLINSVRGWIRVKKELNQDIWKVVNFD